LQQQSSNGMSWMVLPGMAMVGGVALYGYKHMNSGSTGYSHASGKQKYAGMSEMTTYGRGHYVPPSMA